MLHLFIDTNVLLTFYSFTADDLEELRKLRVAINNGDLKLWMPEQVKREFRRNRESRVAESMKALRGMRPNDGIPHMARNLPQSAALLTARREYGEQLNTVEERLRSEFAEGSLAADSVLNELMEIAEEIPTTDELLVAARARTDIGDPPGKRGSLGDAINWESLLASCQGGNDLYFVTDDADYVSKVDRDNMLTALVDEWRQAKESEIYLYRRISEFLRDNFENIELAAEFEKELRVQALANSPSFEETHRRINRLSGYTEFSDQQVRDLFEAAFTNLQIRWIAYDSDVQSFFQELVDEHRELFEPEELERFHRYFDPEEEEDPEGSDDIPF